MSPVEEVNPSKLEREEDCCDEEPTTRRNVQMTIVGEEPAAKDYAVTTTLHYSTEGDMQKGLLDCLQDAVLDISAQGDFDI